jgi:DnaJ-class molecular chaperone
LRKDRFEDPVMQEAWEELDDYLKEGSQSQRHRQRPQGEWARESERETLRQDYANLEVSFGAPLPEVKKAYKRLLKFYHPDRNADDPGKLRMATEITQKLNGSFQKIKDFEEGKTRT